VDHNNLRDIFAMLVLNMWYHRHLILIKIFMNCKVLHSMTLPGGTRSLLSGVASVVNNSKSWISQVTRHEKLKIKLYLPCDLLAILDPCLISHQHKSKKHEDLKISVIYLSNLSESQIYLILSFQSSLSSVAYISIFGCPKIMNKFWTIVDFNIFLWP
jgi:hypothetical protein